MALDCHLNRVSFEIEDWSAVKARANWNTLLLGNGASIAIDQCFDYKSLLAEARRNPRLSSAACIFDELGTEDFEFVLRACWHAIVVNDALKITSDSVKAISESVRTALIEAVRAHHCGYSDAVCSKLDAAARFIKSTGCHLVLSLNYDLTLYWAIMRYNKAAGNSGCSFADLFNPDSFAPESFNLGPATTRVFYPHGALFLARPFGPVRQGASEGAPGEAKITRASEHLLESIIERWCRKDCGPLFVSEGTSPAKRQAIASSPYLSYVHSQILPTAGSTVVYGFGFADQDEHILKAIGKSRPRHLAISVHGDPATAKQRYCPFVRAQLGKHADFKETKLHFFRSDSPGCWCNPPETDDVPF